MNPSIHIELTLQKYACFFLWLDYAEYQITNLRKRWKITGSVPIYNQFVRSFHGYFNITFCSLEFYFHFIFFISELILRILNSSCVFLWGNHSRPQRHFWPFNERLILHNQENIMSGKEYHVLIAHRAYLLILKRKVYCCFRFR